MREAEPGPEVLAALEAIDATLAGEPVDPDFAEIAELALLVRADRPVLREEFATSLDRRIRERFKPASTAPIGSKPRPRRRWRWTVAPAGGLLVAGLVAVAVVISGSSGSSVGGSASSSSSAGLSISSAKQRAARHPARSLAAPARNSQGLTPAPALRVPNARGRKLTQSSQLTLGAARERIETVAQEIYNVVGDQNGFVDSSSVTSAGTGGYAHFQLSVPSITLPQTMSALSTLPYAKVLQRTDTVEDITGQFRDALRHHKKKQLKALRRQVAYSQVTINVQAVIPPPPVHHHSRQTGFSIASAAHTALRVLVVIAGIALIALAVLVPLALVAALLWWIADALKRRRREQALDAA